MKNKKTLIAIIAVLLVLVVGATIAYFQSSASFENVFNTGTYKVVATEEFVSPDNWKPGEEIPKTIKTTNEGTIPAAVRASITEQWIKEIDGVETDITNQVANGTAIINLDNTDYWTHEGNYYYYKYILEPGDTTKSFIKSVTLNPNINGATCVASQDGLTQTCESNNPALGATYKLTITKETVQADKYQEVWNTNVSITEKPPAVTILSGTKGNLQPGDKIGIGDSEDFYVISSDNSENGKTLLLAKYNLYVGKKYDENGEYIGMIQSSESSYGLQSELAIGGYFQDSASGIVPFSSSNYWIENDTLISPYNENNTIIIENNQEEHYEYNEGSKAHPYVYDENSNIYQYISGENGYVNRLKEMGAPSTITGRLLSYNESVNLESVEDNGISIIHDNHQSYWLGSSNKVEFIDLIFIGNPWVDSYYYYEDTNQYGCGIRPVIEVYTKDIN